MRNWCLQCIECSLKMSRTTIIMEEQVPFPLREEACFVEGDNLTLKVCKQPTIIRPFSLL